MEVKGKKKITGKDVKTSQEKNIFHKNSGKIVLPNHVAVSVVTGGRGWWDEGA